MSRGFPRWIRRDLFQEIGERSTDRLWGSLVLAEPSTGARVGGATTRKGGGAHAACGRVVSEANRDGTE